MKIQTSSGWLRCMFAAATLLALHPCAVAGLQFGKPIKSFVNAGGGLVGGSQRGRRVECVNLDRFKKRSVSSIDSCLLDMPNTPD